MDFELNESGENPLEKIDLVQLKDELKEELKEELKDEIWKENIRVKRPILNNILCNNLTIEETSKLTGLSVEEIYSILYSH